MAGKRAFPALLALLASATACGRPELPDPRVAAHAYAEAAARGDAAALHGMLTSDAKRTFKKALARRSYPALLRVLSSKARTAVEMDLRSLEAGLADPKTLDVKVTGDRAEVEIPGGHAVTLERDGGTWRVDDVQ